MVVANYAGKKGKLLPYGNARPAQSAKSITRVGKSGRVGRGQPSPALFAMPRTGSGGPADWWIEGAKRESPTAPSSANATRENAIVNAAFTRGGYA